MTITPLVADRQASARRDAADGVRSMLPWLVGVIPFGMVVGMTVRSSGVSTAVGMATGATIYSGSAQLTALELLRGGAGVAVVVTSVLVINARLILYGSSLAPHWSGTGLGFRAAASYLVVDPSFVVGMHRYHKEPRGGHTHFLAAGITLWVAWQAAMVAGLALGGGVPGWLSLERAVPLFLLAELVRVVKSRPALNAAVIGAAAAVVGSRLPLHGGVLVGAVAGVTAALVSERGGS